MNGEKLPACRRSIVELACLVPVLLLAAGVRILGIGNSDLWGDEAFSVMTALGPPRDLLGSLATAEPHPPLYPLLLAGWLRAFGRSEVVARLPSAAAGIAGVAVAVMLARALVPAGRHEGAWRARLGAGMVGGLLVALSPFQVWYSQEARMYAQLSFFAGLATLALLRLWQDRGGAGVVYALALVGAMGSHYYGLFIPLAHGLAVAVLGRHDRPFATRWLRAALAAGLIYLPWVVYALSIFTHYFGAPPGTVNLPALALSSWVRVAAGWSLTWEQAEIAAALATALVVIGLAFPPTSRDDQFLRLALGLWLVVPFAVGFVVSLVRPMYAERYLVVSSLPFALLATRGIVRLTPRPILAVGLLALTLVAALVPLDNVWRGQYLKSNYSVHTAAVGALARPNDAVILDGASQTPLYDYYARAPLPTFPEPSRLPFDPSRTAAELGAIEQEHAGAWIFLYAVPDYDPSYFVPRWLTSNAYRSYDVWSVNGRLQYYRFAPGAALAGHDAAIAFETALDLERYAVAPAPVAAGDTIPIDLHWKLAPTVDHPSLSFRLVDSTGLTWAQSDQAIGGDFLPTTGAPDRFDDRHGLMVPPGTPPGTYKLLLNAYTASHPRPLGASGSGATIGPAGVQLATVQVDAPSRSFWPDQIAGFHPSGAAFGGEIALLGYAGSDGVTAGSSGYLTIVWKALRAPTDVRRLRLELIGGDGRVAEQRDLAFATDGYPTTRWQSGDVLREQYRVPIGSQVPAGSYRLVAVPLAGTTPIGAAVSLGPLAVQAGAPTPPTAGSEHPLQLTLADAVALDGYDLAPSNAHPGGNVQLTLHWRATGQLDADYTVFVHLLADLPNGRQKVVAQQDKQPADGQRPTSAWLPGDTILDRYSLALPPTLAPGDYPIEVGMYDANTGQRLPVADDGQPSGDRAVIARLRVTAGG